MGSLMLLGLISFQSGHGRQSLYIRLAPYQLHTAPESGIACPEAVSEVANLSLDCISGSREVLYTDKY